MASAAMFSVAKLAAAKVEIAAAHAVTLVEQSKKSNYLVPETPVTTAIINQGLIGVFSISGASSVTFNAGSAYPPLSVKKTVQLKRCDDLTLSLSSQ